jgi:hypothetical protein
VAAPIVSARAANNWLPVSTVEWIASLSFAELPVNPPAANLVAAITALPARAA